MSITMIKKKIRTKIMKVDGIPIEVELLNNIKPEDIPDETTGSHRNIKTLAEKILF